MYGYAAIAMVAAITLCNLTLTFGIIRRLREQAAILNQANSAEQPPIMKREGEVVGDFTAVTVDGKAVDNAILQDHDLVGFFSPGCPACTDQLPAFVDLAAKRTESQGSTLAVVVGSTDEAAPVVERLRPIAKVVVEGNGGVLSSAFDVRGFPAFGMVDAQGVVKASGWAVSAVADPVAP